MAPLHATPARAAPADVHLEAPPVRTHDGQILLDLDRDARLADVAVAPGTRCWQGDVDDLVDLRRRKAMCLTPMLTAGTSTHRASMRRRHPSRTGRPGVCPPAARQPAPASTARSPGATDLARAHARNLVTQALATLAQLLILPSQAFHIPLAGRLRRAWLAARTHATVMPESPPKYK